MKCPACGVLLRRVQERYVFTSPYTGDTYYLFKCTDRACSLMFWEPRVVSREFYENEALLDYKKIHDNADEWRPAFDIFLSQRQFRGRLLDIGCGNGAFIRKALECGFDVYGIDLDAKSVDACRKRGLKNVHNCSFKDFIASNPHYIRTFDVVTFFEVLEHQDNPGEFLSEVTRLIKPSGHLAFSCPNRRSVASYLLRLNLKIMPSHFVCRLTQGDLPPHHFTWWTSRSVTHLLRLHGLAEISTILITAPIKSRAEFYTKSCLVKLISLATGKTISLPRFLAYPIACMPWGFRNTIYAQARLP